MKAPEGPEPPGMNGFRLKLLLAMMLVVSIVMAPALYFAQRNAAAQARRDLTRSFQERLAALRSIQEVRLAALAERCRSLARKPRIHAALEDNAVDLLYPNARDELGDIMSPVGEGSGFTLRAEFYRFLDARGTVIPPPETGGVGALDAAETARLNLPRVPNRLQTGYLAAGAPGAGFVHEIIAMPIFSTESGEPISALVLGFKRFDPAEAPIDRGIQRGVWIDGGLQLPALAPPARASVAAALQPALARGEGDPLPVTLEGAPCLVFFQLLNPGSLFPPAYEVMICPLTESLAARQRLLWEFGAVWGALLLLALGASHYLSARLSTPVEQLVVDSATNRSGRRRAEAALEMTHEELQRSVRFSADASHQLKTPVTILRVGLEELLAGEKLSGEVREEVSSLVHQTFRLTSVIEDLLLLSRMDAGRLHLEFSRVELNAVIEAALDDLSALPDEFDLTIETDFPPDLFIEGERRYVALILQNLLENARKYNRPGGRIRLTARREDASVLVILGNTGQVIPAEAQSHIFERFHRGTIGENVPGHGLGLNLARQLARLHRGDLRLLRSDPEFTEFELRFRRAGAAVAPAPQTI